MSDPITPQPWWAAVLVAVLASVRWLVGFGGQSAAATILSQAKEIRRLSERIDGLEIRQQTNEKLIDELRAQNALLRQQIEGASLECTA